MLYLVGIIIDFFLVVILTSKREKSEGDKILALWLFFTGLHLLSFYLQFKGNYLGYPTLLGLEIPLPLLHGPFLFLYTTSLTNKIPHRKISLLHFAPLIIAYLLFIPFFTLSAERKIFVYQNEGMGFESLMSVMSPAFIISGIIYSLLSLHKLLKHKKTITDQFSYTETVNLMWLRYLILGTSIIWLVVIFSHDKYIFATVVLYILFIGYFGIKQVGIFTYKQRIIQDFIPPLSDKVKYHKSGLNDSSAETFHKQLTVLMEQEKLYKNPELTLSELSQNLKAHPNILSQVINSIEQKNFYDYINCQRVEEFKHIVTLPENQKFTLLSLAFECGFNSKTSFNRNFKKETGLSPSEYLKQINISLK